VSQKAGSAVAMENQSSWTSVSSKCPMVDPWGPAAKEAWSGRIGSLTLGLGVVGHVGFKAFLLNSRVTSVSVGTSFQTTITLEKRARKGWTYQGNGIARSNSLFKNRSRLTRFGFCSLPCTKRIPGWGSNNTHLIPS
jgi:hypothetical protein